MRPDEKGTPLVFTGQVRDLAGVPVAAAELDVWHADGEGYYSGFAPTFPRATSAASSSATTGAGSRSPPSSPPPTRSLPTDPTGKLIEAAGWHPWRPGHLHLIVRAPGYRPITTQLYFEGGDWLDDDVARATKPELVLDPQSAGDGTLRVEYDFVLEPVH